MLNVHISHHAQWCIWLGMVCILWKVRRMTSNDLDMLNVKNTNMHAAYTPEAQVFVRFALRWTVFELRVNFVKSAPNDSKRPWHVQRQNYHYACYIHPPRPIFSSISLYDAPFSSCAPFFGKVHRMTANDLHMLKVKTTQYACYIHP